MHSACFFQSPQIFAPLQTAKYWTETFAAEKKSSNDEKAALLGGIAEEVGIKNDWGDDFLRRSLGIECTVPRKKLKFPKKS